MGIEIKKEMMPKIRTFEKSERIPSEFWGDKIGIKCLY